MVQGWVRRANGLAALLVCAMAVPATHSGAQEAERKKLEAIEEQLKEKQGETRELNAQAQAKAAEVDNLQKKLVAAAAAVQGQEDKLSQIELNLADLGDQESKAQALLDHRRAQMAGGLAALERLSQQPTTVLVARPTSTIDTARTGNLLKIILPRLRENAAQLGHDVANVRELRAQIAADKAALLAAGDQLDSQRKDLAALLEQRKTEQAELEKNVEAEKQAADKLADQAKDLKDLIARLDERRRQREIAEAREAERRAAEAKKAGEKQIAALPPATFPEATGNLPLPARGRLVRNYGERGTDGNPTRGITIETRASAQVVAPYDGKVEFAGPFRDYGLLLIIRHGGGYLSLLSGMSRIDAAVGQQVKAGEPVGEMGDTAPRLYVELRKNNEPVNPLPWLAAGERKVSG